MKIVTVCGMGLGSSLLLKISVEKAAKDLGIKADVEHWDMGTVQGKERDLIVASEEFRKNLTMDDVVFIRNIMDANEVKEKISAYLSEKGA